MKRNYISKTIISKVICNGTIITKAIIPLCIFLVFSCKEKTGQKPVAEAHEHELHIDSSLLPLLKPVNEQVISSMPPIKVESGTRIFSVPVQGTIGFDRRNQVSISSRVAGRIERMNIKYNYQPISKGQLIMEIYSPDLAAAQQELIYISRSDDDASLLQRAKQRLSLLGMQPAQISQVLKTGKPLYRVPVFSSVSGYIVERNVANSSSSAPMPSSQQTTPGMDGMGGSSQAATSTSQAPVNNQTAISQTPVMIREGQYLAAGETIFTIYQSDNMVAEFSFIPSLATDIKKGQKLVFHTVSNPNDVMTGTIGLIEPTQRNGESFNVARGYLSNTNLQPGQLLTANIPVVKTNAWWLPEKAVLRLGNQSVVFKKEQTVFIPESIKTGSTINGMVEILDNISDWQVAKNASYLVDSESFIRINSNEKK
ncbi:MAG: efflux RND transporter periplasmic adaptor subunit [Flavitalea sp.]